MKRKLPTAQERSGKFVSKSTEETGLCGCLHQPFSAGGQCPETFWLSWFGGGSALGIWQVWRGRDAVQHPAAPRMPPPIGSDLAAKVSRAAVTKPWFKPRSPNPNAAESRQVPSTRDHPFVKGLRRVEGMSKLKGKADPHLPPTETMGDHGSRSPDLSIFQEGSKVWIPCVLKHR